MNNTNNIKIYLNKKENLTMKANVKIKQLNDTERPIHILQIPKWGVYYD